MTLDYLRVACTLLAVSCIAPAHAQSADDAVVLVKKAKAYLKSQGVEKACKDFADVAAGFQKGELYVSVLDMREAGHLKFVCHPKNARMNGKDVIELKDSDGKPFNKEIAELSKTKGQGWVNYRWVNPVSGNMEAKTSYFEAQDGLVLLAGIYKK